jgi:rhodanese-related sulfurtransferase
MPIKAIAKELSILLGIALAAAFVFNDLSPQGIALIGNWDTSKGVVSARSKDDVVFDELEIDDVETAKQIYDRGNAVFVDARAEEMFAEGHIQGAISMPLGRFDAYIDKFKRDHPLSEFIVTYCSGRECDDSHKLAQHLLEAGYTNISIFIDGYPGWEKAGYPIEK